MRLGWVGARILVGGIAIVAAGYLLMVQAIPYAGLVVGVGLVAVAGGSGALCMAPRPPFTGTVARLGLGVLAAGAACLDVSAILAAGLTFDPLESTPVVVFGLIGLSFTPIGLMLTLLALVRRLASRG